MVKPGFYLADSSVAFYNHNKLTREFPGCVPRNEMILLAIVALSRLGLCAYRAATQSITHDEAFTYLQFVSGPWSNLFSNYDANNHVLTSVRLQVEQNQLVGDIY